MSPGIRTWRCPGESSPRTRGQFDLGQVEFEPEGTPVGRSAPGCLQPASGRRQTAASGTRVPYPAVHAGPATLDNTMVYLFARGSSRRRILRKRTCAEGLGSRIIDGSAST